MLPPLSCCFKADIRTEAEAQPTDSEDRPFYSITLVATPRFAERALWNIDSGSASLRLDVECPDDVAPFLRFVGDELAKVGGRQRECVAAQVGKPRLELGIGKASVDLLVELLDDLGRRGLRCADAVPGARLVARQRPRPDAENFGGEVS